MHLKKKKKFVGVAKLSFNRGWQEGWWKHSRNTGNSYKTLWMFIFPSKVFFFFLFYNIVLVLPYIKMNLPQVYMCSPSWNHLPPPSPYHPSGSCQCTSPKHPVSCIKPGLATRFIYDITRFNAIIPNHPTLSGSHRVQKIVLYISVSFAVSSQWILGVGDGQGGLACCCSWGRKE